MGGDRRRGPDVPEMVRSGRRWWPGERAGRDDAAPWRARHPQPAPGNRNAIRVKTHIHRRPRKTRRAQVARASSHNGSQESLRIGAGGPPHRRGLPGLVAWTSTVTVPPTSSPTRSRPMASCPRRPRRTARMPRHHQPSRTTSSVESDRPLDMKPRAGEVVRVGAGIESTGLRFLCSDIVV
jgi:hypothetical protein